MMHCQRIFYKFLAWPSPLCEIRHEWKSKIKQNEKVCELHVDITSDFWWHFFIYLWLYFTYLRNTFLWKGLWMDLTTLWILLHTVSVIFFMNTVCIPSSCCIHFISELIKFLTFIHACVCHWHSKINECILLPMNFLLLIDEWVNEWVRMKEHKSMLIAFRHDEDCCHFQWA